jgi:hypothetical protein
VVFLEVFDFGLVKDGSTVPQSKMRKKAELAELAVLMAMVVFMLPMGSPCRGQKSVEVRSADYFYCGPTDHNYLQTSFDFVQGRLRGAANEGPAAEPVGVRGFPPIRQKKANGWGTGSFLGVLAVHFRL